ncbi:hypothetical protein [Blastopirellula retiformator]|uniref:Uncharacterized protein n=1 Tax=Blastopirellula retiformator TaxID=2527970 RepID=A0A5C5V4J9_9BACT|nr:hypothetical protein [Blastopirellula retiformator]TWT32687.1 hypothetical protein Enr8_24920 [Blastopirellula retiformator]
MRRSGRTHRASFSLGAFANMLLIEGCGLLAIAAMLGAPLDGLSPPAGQDQAQSTASCSWGACTPIAAVLRFLQINE